MPMKTKDLAVATALLIQGYLRANEDNGHPESYNLEDAIGVITKECDDWSDNLGPPPSMAVNHEERNQ